MPFDEEQNADITTLVRKTLGLEEGKTLADALESHINDTLNRYDKRKKKDAEGAATELSEKLGEMTKALDELKGAGGGGGGGGGGEGDDGEVDVSKLPAGVREIITKQNQTLKDLQTSLDAEKKAREKEAGEREKIQAETARHALRDAIRTGLLNKDTAGAEYDPADIDVLIDRLEGSVRLENGQHEFQTGVDDVTKDPVFKSLNDGLKEFSKGTLAKRFQRARGGAGGGTPSGGEGGGGDTGDKIPASELEARNLSPPEIVKLNDEGKIDYTQ